MLILIPEISSARQKHDYFRKILPTRTVFQFLKKLFSFLKALGVIE